MTTPILIVDDSTMSRKIMIRSLPKEWDVDISQACNGQEALDAYHAGKADVIFLDLNMPIMDGYEVLKTLQQKGLKTFVIVVSADIQPKARERVLALGAMDFIQKPIDTATITDTLNQFGII